VWISNDDDTKEKLFRINKDSYVDFIVDTNIIGKFVEAFEINGESSSSADIKRFAVFTRNNNNMITLKVFMISRVGSDYIYIAEFKTFPPTKYDAQRDLVTFNKNTNMAMVCHHTGCVEMNISEHNAIKIEHEVNCFGIDQIWHTDHKITLIAPFNTFVYNKNGGKPMEYPFSVLRGGNQIVEHKDKNLQLILGSGMVWYLNLSAEKDDERIDENVLMKNAYDYIE